MGVILPDKQEKFCMEYAKTANATQAYKDAGYKVKNDNVAAVGAQKLLALPKIQVRLGEIQGKIEENPEKAADIASIEEIKRFFTAVLRDELDEEVIINEGLGRGFSKGVKMNKRADLKDRLKAAELLGKTGGMFTQDINLTGAIPIVICGEESLED